MLTFVNREALVYKSVVGLNADVDQDSKVNIVKKPRLPVRPNHAVMVELVRSLVIHINVSVVMVLLDNIARIQQHQLMYVNRDLVRMVELAIHLTRTIMYASVLNHSRTNTVGLSLHHAIPHIVLTVGHAF